MLMQNLKSLLLRTLLAAGMLAGAGHAFAGPLYHVDIDTHLLPGAGAYLDFLFAGPASSAAPSAAISNVTGSFTEQDSFAWGDPRGSLGTGLILGNGDEFGEWVAFGGILSFDLSFAGANDAGTPGIDLSVALLGADQFSYAPGTSGNLATFSLQPGAPDGLTVERSLATVNAVPEPASLGLMAGGFALLAGGLRRRRR
jgi:hypothetical protein